MIEPSVAEVMSLMKKPAGDSGLFICNTQRALRATWASYASKRAANATLVAVISTGKW